MDITFDKVKTNLESIIEEFRRSLNSGDYNNAKQITKTILNLYEFTYGVELDTNPEFNHIFHEAIKKMDMQIMSNHPEPSKTIEHQELLKMFVKVADGVFKVADVRKKAMEMDPTAEELISSYEKGISDAEEKKKKILEVQKKYKEIKTSIYGKEEPDLKDKIEDGKFSLGRIDSIKTKILELNELQKAIDMMESEISKDSSLESRNRGNIEANKLAISNGRKTMESMLNELKNKGINIDSIKNALSANNEERMGIISNIDVKRLEIDKKLSEDYNTLLNNLKTALSKNPDVETLKNIDFSKMNPDTQEGRKSIEEGLKPFLDVLKDANQALALQNNHIEVFKKSIEEVKEEREIMNLDSSNDSRYTSAMTDEIKRKIEDDEAYYKQDEIDKMYGNPEKAEKWKKYLKLFKTAEKEAEFELRDIDGNIILDSDGNAKLGKYKTIDYAVFDANLSNLTPPVSREDALKLLQLEEYKTRLERISKIRSGDKYSYRELPSFGEFEKAKTTEEQNKAMEKMNKELDEDLTYIKTNHQASNSHEYISNAIGNAGSLVKFKNGIEPLKGKSFGGKIKAIGHNAISLLGLKDLDDAKTGIGKTATVVFNAGMIAISPLSLATKIVYRYTPVVGKEAQKKRYMEKFDGEHSSPYEGRKDARKMARRNEYKSQMSGIFKGARAWIKATNDNLFKKDRAEETEELIMDRHFEENIKPSIHNRYINGAKAQDAELKRKAEENLEIRKSAAREIASRAVAQGDLVAEPEKAEKDVLEARAIQGAALELNGLNSEKIRYSDTYRIREKRFISIKRALGALHGDLKADKIDFSNPEGSVVQTDSIDMATRQKAIDSTYTARNYVPYVLTGVAVGMGTKYVISRIRPKTEQVIPGETTREKKFTGRYEDVEEITKVPQYKEVPDTSSVARTPSQFADMGDGVTEHVHRSVWGGERGGYTVDISSYDHSAGFYVEVPNSSGTIEKIAIAIPKDNGKYDYLGQLVTKYGLDQTTVEKYIDMTSGTFKPDADLYSLAADISNHSGATSGLTGNELVEMVYNSQAKAYVELLKTEGGRNGGWIDATVGQVLKNTRVEDGFKEVVKTVKKPVYEWVESTVPDKVIKTAGSAQIISDTVGAVGGIGHVVEATEKATRPLDSKLKEKDVNGTKTLDKPDKVEPGRRKKQDDDWTIDI